MNSYTAYGYYSAKTWDRPDRIKYTEANDDKIWATAVFLLDKELGKKGHVCHCDGCGGSM